MFKLEKRPFGFIVFESDGTAVAFDTDEQRAVDLAAETEGRWYEGLYRRDGRPMAEAEDALRAERVVLQDENQELHEDLKRYEDADKRMGALEASLKASAHHDVVLYGLVADIEKRITDVAESIGRRVGALHERHNALEKRLDKDSEDIGKLASSVVGIIDGTKVTCTRRGDAPDFSVAPFPTGGASTAETAAEAVLPVPQRGDRVRLEGAVSTGKTYIRDGWYEVTGRYEARFPGDHNQFQVGNASSMGLYWVYDTDPGLKEVRHADRT